MKKKKIMRRKKIKSEIVPTLDEFVEKFDLEAIQEAGLALLVTSAIADWKVTRNTKQGELNKQFINLFFSWKEKCNKINVEKKFIRICIQEKFINLLILKHNNMGMNMESNALIDLLFCQLVRYRKIRHISLSQAAREICDFIFIQLESGKIWIW